MVTTRQRMPAANSTFAIAGRTCFYDSFVGKQTLVFQISICGETPSHRKSAKRYTFFINKNADHYNLHFLFFFPLEESPPG
jgi:hypothetical protein